MKTPKKVMTTEAKASAYCEALRKANALAATFLHKLKESEDEKMIRVIRLALTDVPEERFTTEGTSLSEVLAWLAKQKEQKPLKEIWKEMRFEIYAQAFGNRHEPNPSDDSSKMFSLCDIDEIFEKIGNSTVERQPFEETPTYIRKEFLLEWAKEKAVLYTGTANIRKSFEMMIRKIKSL